MAKRKKGKKQRISPRAKWKPAPLPSSFMLIALLGFIISAYSVYPRNISWGLAFLILFSLMFVASLISMVESDPMAEWEMEKRHL